VFYDLHKYLIDDVSRKFQEFGSINAFDFFCIIIWKANRVKSKIAKKLLEKFISLEDAAKEITSELYKANSDLDRFKYLCRLKGLQLPMISAILTVLYPDRFLVYDYRICSHQEMNEFKNISKKDPLACWKRYQCYIEKAKGITPSKMTLRQKDQYLWGMSFASQLKSDITNNFKK
jgi:hypothetical protein